MRLSHIQIEDYLGVRKVDLPLRGPITLFCGPNYSGKSSIRDAVALALTGDLGRVGLVKEAPRLIREGASSAYCSVTAADTGVEWGVMIHGGGTIKDHQKGQERDPTWPYVLDAQRVAGLTPTERRAFLYELMGVKTDQGDIARRLEARGCHIGKVSTILSLLRGGIDLAAEAAKSKATESRVAWRVITGEAWGSEKAKTWRAQAGEFDAGELKRTETAIQHADVALANWQQELGRLQGIVRARAALQAKQPALAAQVDKIASLEGALADNTKALAEWEDDLRKTTTAAGAAPRAGLVHDLARCLFDLVLSLQGNDVGVNMERAQAALEAYEKEHGAIATDAVGDARARERLPAVKASRDRFEAAVRVNRVDLDAARAAKAELDRIAAELATPAQDQSEAQDNIVRIEAERIAAQAKVERLRAAKKAAETADDKTKQAGEHAVDVGEWAAIAEALSPDGIPAELLAAALTPINERLVQSSADTDWPQVIIRPDMTITYGGRDYRLLSVSEQWRCDAMLAEAVAHISGTQLLVLDKMDVLDIPGRSDLIGWLQTLAEQKELDTALVFATLKAPPALEGVQVEWLDDGTIQQQKEAA